MSERRRRRSRRRRGGRSGGAPASSIERAARRLGIERLYEEQVQIVQHLLGGGDCLAVLPTGYGKSALYQVPSMIMPRPVLVVSPLLALIEDQHAQLSARGIPAVRLDSTLGAAARREALAKIRAGGPLLVLTTAETLGSDELAAAVGREPPSLVAIDEAHTASEWGHDFRPAYLRVGEVARRLGECPRLALTATATAPVRDDLIGILGLRDPLVVVRGPHRPNLRFEVIVCSGAARLRALARLTLDLARPAIVYCATTKDVDAVSRALVRLGIPARHYHGGMPTKARKEEQRLFMRPGRRVVMVATSAFGLGIDKPDIRSIVHYQAPASIEQYVQEAGRAGRDGKPARCVLLYAPEDRQIHEFLQSKSRVRPDQLRRLTATLGSFRSERAKPTVDTLAQTAGLAQRTTEALLATLEEAGAGSLGAGRSVTLPARPGAPLDRLADGMDRLRRLDSERLDAVDRYADSTACRARYLDAYFGVEGLPPCGVCDVCQGATERPRALFAPLERRQPKRGRSKRRGSQDGSSKRGGSKRGSTQSGSRRKKPSR